MVNKYALCRIIMHRTHLAVTDRTAAEEGGYRVVVSARNDEGMPELDLAQLNTDRYLANPVVLWQHDQYEGLPIGRTTRLEMAPEGLVAEFEFLPSDELADRVRNAWDRGFLGAASAGWKYEKDRTPTLLEWSLVSVPRDPEALRASHGAMLEHLLKEEAVSDKSQQPAANHQAASGGKIVVEEGVLGGDEAPLGEGEALLGEESIPQGAQGPIGQGPAGPIGQSPAGSIGQGPAGPIGQSPAGSIGTTDPPPGAAGQSSDEEQVRAAAQKRAELLVAAQRLVPDKDFSTLSDLEILQAAVGDRVPEGHRGDESYLRGVLDTVISARSQAPSNDPQVASASRGPVHYQRPNIMSLIAQRDSVTQRS